MTTFSDPQMGSVAPTTKRGRYLHRWTMMRNERSSWFTHWREITDFLLPRNGRYFTQDRNRGNKRHNNLYDSAGTRALRVLAAGMMLGNTNPGQPWVKLVTPDPELNKYKPVAIWLQDAARRMMRVFDRSNTYRTLHQMYEEMGAFGTAGSIVVPNFETVIHHHPLTIGEYCIAQDWQGRIVSLYREFEKTVGEVVQEFGLERCSEATKNAWSGGRLDDWVPILHAIEPRYDRDQSKPDPKNMPWRSVYLELRGNENDDVLRESGFRRFPALVPRWLVTGGDIYGHSPGMDALGDIKGLQHKHVRRAEVINQKTDPALQITSSLKNRPINTLPGGRTFVDGNNPNGGIKTAFDVDLSLADLDKSILDDRESINATFYVNLFRSISSVPTTARMTAEEVLRRYEESRTGIGPVVERLEDDMLEPLVDMTFDAMLEAGVLPPPPPELLGVNLDVEFMGLLSQAQRAVGVNATDRFVGNLGAISQFKPDVLDKFDADAWADITAEDLGVDPRLIVPNELVDQIRLARNQALAAQDQSAALQQNAKTVKDLTGAKTSDKNVLTDIIAAR